MIGFWIGMTVLCWLFFLVLAEERYQPDTPYRTAKVVLAATVGTGLLAGVFALALP